MAHVADRIGVLTVANDLFIQSGIRSMLSGPQVDIVGEVANPHEVANRAKALQPRVVINALLQPQQSVDAVSKVRAAMPDVPILVLSTGDRDHLADVMAYGATSLFLTPRSGHELLSAVRLIDAGYTVVPRDVRGDVPCPDPLRKVPQSSPLHKLTRRELEILVLVADGSSNQAIAEFLTVGAATVKTHVHRILNKLGLQNRVQAVAYAHQAGLAGMRGRPEWADRSEISRSFNGC